MSRVSLIPLAFCLLLAGCEGGEPEVLTSDAGPVVEAGVGSPQGTPCTGTGSQACSCAGDVTGTQTCTAGAWSACMCGAMGGDECEGNASQACSCADGRTGMQSCFSGIWANCLCTGIDPNASLGTQGQRCKPGYYEGDFIGDYFPGFADPTSIFGGGGFLGSFLQVEVTALTTADKPGLFITLEAEETVGGSLDGIEFGSVKVKDGCVVGTAVDDLAGTQNPFVGVLEGELDCETGEFMGTMTGYYKLFGADELPYGFEGPLTSQFYADPDRLGDGTWDVREESMAASPPGGQGTWEVTRVGDTDAAPPLPQECVDFLAGNVETTSSDDPDAGVTAP